MKEVLSQKLPKFTLALGIALLLTACAGQPVVPATAEEAVAALEAEAPAVATSEDEGEGLICRSEVRTGTTFRRRTCRTAEEWNAISQRQRGVAEDRANNERGQAGVDNAGGGTGTNAVGP